ncbi:hypothetical protein [Desulforhopalus sp. IMCC35007]|jgi:hypothetical protein|uniref:hypothetical protein n=1 Tax=Desulforhopalus sp. IMCC35007 TaxID=2569543 RepID=UPI0010AE96C4|nr:hypothetical protein [Desulforhopalus sp. IMCC35007]TKB12323.1 hypothetical protein FCL48_01340 [Desulforhopalus sp. IMCC35007]
MAIPKPKKSADDFIKGAVATKAETELKGQGRGRPVGPKKGALPVRLPYDLLETIRENSAGNLSYFTEKVFRDYFARNNIDIKK